MAKIRCLLSHMKNQKFVCHGNQYRLDDNGICESIKDEDAERLSKFSSGMWKIILEKKISEVPEIKETYFNKDKPTLQETIDMVLAKKSNKKLKEKADG